MIRLNILLIGIIALLFFNKAAQAQDTLYYKGLLMSQIGPICYKYVKHRFANNSISCYRTNTLNDHIFVQVDTTYQYEQGLSKGVFIMSSTRKDRVPAAIWENIKILNENFKETGTEFENFDLTNDVVFEDRYCSRCPIGKWNTSVNKESSVQVHFFPFGDYWNELIRYAYGYWFFDIAYFSVPVEMEYVYIGEGEFEVMNIDGYDTNTVFKTIKTPTYIITKIRKLPK